MKGALNLFARLTTLEKIFLAFLLTSQAYYAYRYAFKFQSSLAPSSYSFTPEFLQYLKYAIAAFFFVALVLVASKNQIALKGGLAKVRRERVWLFVLAFLLFAGISTLKFVDEPSAAGDQAKLLFVIPFVFLVPIIWATRGPKDLVFLFLIASSLYHVGYEIIMLSAHSISGRLTGLTFSEVLPRYGGGWDDPNGFGAFLILGIAWLFVLRLPPEPLRRTAFLGALAAATLMVLFTYSVTAGIGLVSVVSLLLLCRRFDVIKISTVFTVFVVFFLVHLQLGHVDLIVDGKLNSLTGHTQVGSPRPERPVSQDSPGNTPPGLVGEPDPGGSSDPSFLDQIPIREFAQISVGHWDRPQFHETFYVFLYLNYGLIGLSLFVAIFGLTFRQSLRRWREERESRLGDFFLFSTVCLFAFGVMNLLLPLFATFPVNLFVWVLIGLVWTMEPATLQPESRRPSKSISRYA